MLKPDDLRLSKFLVISLFQQFRFGFLEQKNFICADLNSGSQNVADPMDPDTKHCLKVF